MNKPLIGIIGSAVLTFIGILLRLNARAMAWAGVSSWSSPASETSYGRQETAIGQIGLALMFAGILIFWSLIAIGCLTRSQATENPSA